MGGRAFLHVLSSCFRSRSLPTSSSSFPSASSSPWLPRSRLSVLPLAVLFVVHSLLALVHPSIHHTSISLTPLTIPFLSSSLLLYFSLSLSLSLIFIYYALRPHPSLHLLSPSLLGLTFFCSVNPSYTSSVFIRTSIRIRIYIPSFIPPIHSRSFLAFPSPLSVSPAPCHFPP
ncbi:hypothetical protein B0H19DRAFT_1200930 [Mycena capillaripes]|nr:hypothetical protein B0H19DRAFT_1200930 [Mycena capillaripes]